MCFQLKYLAEHLYMYETNISIDWQNNTLMLFPFWALVLQTHIHYT